MTALKNGHDFLIDEISLADDSVLERLNSVLEEEKTLMLAENVASADCTASSCIQANVNFRIFATMNPSGDFGKKELSAALRNRFTEIWCPSLSTAQNEFKQICYQRLLEPNEHIKAICVNAIDSFIKWLNTQTFFNRIATISVRDLVAWIKFINQTKDTILNNSEIGSILALIHGACLVFIDSLSVSPPSSTNNRTLCMQFLFDQIQDLLSQSPASTLSNLNIESIFYSNLNVIEKNESFVQCGPFRIAKNVTPNSEKSLEPIKYCFESKTTVRNIQRIARCLLMDGPVMLEGSPGVGKTSLVEALAKLTNNKVVRINLSEQTDLNELFGADLPCKSSDSNQV